MAWFPGAIRKEITKHRMPMARHRGFCLHVAVSEAASLFGYFSQVDDCSHFYVRKDGTVEQYVDTAYRAPAQREGNPSMISAETQGGVTNVDTERWTPQQVDSLARIAAWCNSTHSIPLAAMKDSLPASTGVGYHRLGIDPWRVDGGELWSRSYGKVCPGAAKIAQIPTIINLAKETNMPLTTADADLLITRMLATEVEVKPGFKKTIRACLTEASEANDAFAAITNLAAKLAGPGAAPPDVVALVKQALREGTGT